MEHLSGLLTIVFPQGSNNCDPDQWHYTNQDVSLSGKGFHKVRGTIRRDFSTQLYHEEQVNYIEKGNYYSSSFLL